MSIVNRVKDILLKPKDTWAVIEGEEATTSSLYTNYLMILAAIPAVCGFIGMSLIGIGGFGFSIRIPILYGLTTMIVQYVMSLVGVYVLALIINALAPTFGGQKNQLNALKLSVYAATASMLGGLFSLLPTLAILGVLCGLYSIYLIYLGLPVMMKNPDEKSVVYTIVVLLVAIVIGIIMAAIVAMVTPNPYKLGRAGGGDAVFSLKTPGGELKIDTAKMEAAGKQMDEAQKRMEEAQKSGDPSAMAKATGDALAAATGALGGNANLAPIPTDALKLYLLPQMGEFKRTAFEVQSGAAVGLSTTTASADYQAGNKNMHLTITDMGSMSGWISMTGAMVAGERETSTRHEKTWQENGRTIQQQFNKDGSHAELKVILKNGVMVELRGNQVNVDTLRSLSSMLDMNGMENFQRAKKS
jgi:hypothetical protein